MSPAGTDSFAGDAEVVDAVAAAALGVPGVLGLHPGPLGEVGTYLPGRRVAGIRLRPTRTEVHISVELGRDVRRIADSVRDRVAQLRPGAVDVTIGDVMLPGEDTGAGATAAGPATPSGQR